MPSTRNILVPIFAMSLLAACAGPQQPVQRDVASTQVGSALPNTQAAQVAILMSEGRHAFSTGDTNALKSVLARLDDLGARKLEEAANDDIADWRKAVPDAVIPKRGRALGPAYRRGKLSVNGTDKIEQLFLSGKKAVIALESVGGKRPKLAVYDASGDPVCGPNDRAGRCQWIPAFTQRYRIEVANPGKDVLHYYLVIE